MSVIAAVKEAVKAPKKFPEEVPPDIAERIRRGRVAMLKDAPKRRVCEKFWEGDHYWYVNAKGTLSVLPTALVAVEAGKPLHRIRNTYNFAQSIVEGKVSAATQKVPGYEVTPSTNDPDDRAAARLASQIAAYGYDKWRLRRHTVKAVTNALVQREGFVMPYFDENVGPYERQPDGSVKGLGEVRHLSLTRSEVMWEPGMDFDDSPWHAIERAQLPSEIRQIPGFVGGEVKSDANTADIPEGKRSDTMARLTEYLERPCPKYPEGRRVFVHAGRVVVDHRKADDKAQDWWEPFPFRDAQGRVADEPVIHRISYTVNPNGDDMGLMERLIDLSRSVDDAWNKLLEWKNRCLNPQLLAPNGSAVKARADTPGAVIYYNPVGGMKPEWERPPSIPRELFDMLNLAVEQMRALAADVDVQADPNLAAKTANAAIEASRNRWQSFLGDLAEFHSRLMRHDLCLVAQHYSTDRQVEINGHYDWAPLPAFSGQDLRSQVNVRVLPGTLETKGRQQVMEELQFLATAYPGAVSAEAAIAVLHGGNADALLKSPQFDIARAARMVQLLREGMPTLTTQFQPILRPVMQPDPVTGVPTQRMVQVPGWMPRKQDNIPIYKQVVGDYMKTPEYDLLPPQVQEGFNLFYSGLEQSEQERAIEQAQLQVQMAQQSGLANAAKPQGQIAQPDRPGQNNNQQPPAHA